MCIRDRFTRNPDWQFPRQDMQARIDDACGEGQTLFLDTAEMARRLMGDALYGNLFLLGVAWQRGLAVSYTHLDVYKRQRLGDEPLLGVLGRDESPGRYG